MKMNKTWYWTLGSVLILALSFLMRKKGVDMWREAMHRRRMMVAE